MHGYEALKPQDLLVALKLVALQGGAWSYPSLAHDLEMSASGAHDSVRRARNAGLLDGRRKPIRAALEEFLIHGAKYAFPVRLGATTRGMPTGPSAPPLSTTLAAREPPIVWADPAGTVRGESIEPLCRSVPIAAARDPKLYQLLAVTDALRIGSAREREVAADALRHLLLA